MPRRPRVIVPGLPHHVTQRGNNRQRVFFSPHDYRLYLELLARHGKRCGAGILGYCLMPNHVHLVVAPETEASLARTLGCTHSEYALALNRTQERSGHLWQNRFFSCPLSADHLLTAMCYVEMNPVRAGLAAAPWDWPWSSACAHTAAGAADPLLSSNPAEYFGGWDHGEWKEILSASVFEGDEGVRRATRTGQPLGPPDFVAALERGAGKRLRVLARGRPRRQAQGSQERARQGRLFAAGGE